jgi:putative sigma-54 modulation protein
MPLEITVSARHTDISPALRAAAEEKIGRLSRFLGGMDRAEVHFSEEHNPRIPAKEVCEVSLEGHGHHVRCRAAAVDGFAAVDLAVEKLEHQLHKLKTKLVPRKARRAEAEPATDGDDAALVDQP